jgi:glycogen synthase
MTTQFLVSSWTFLPELGGVASNKFTLCNALKDAGYDVSVVTNAAGPDMNLGYPVHRRPGMLKLLRLYMQADVIYLSNPSFKLGWPILFLNKKIGLCHHSDSAFAGDPSKGGFLKKLVANTIMRKAVHFPNSRFTRDGGRAQLEGKRCAVAYPIALKTEVQLGTRDEYKARKDAFFAGRLVADKGVGFLIENWPEIKATLGIEKLRIAGDGALKQELMAKAAGMDGIEFLGRQPLETVVKGMQDSAYVMIPSVWPEPFGNVGVEGMASGAVVISSDRGGLPEAVGDGGVLFSFDDKASFGKALKHARQVRDAVMGSDDDFEAYRKVVNRHLDQFSAKRIISVIKENLDA